MRKRCVAALLVGVRDVESPADQVVGEPAGALGVAVQVMVVSSGRPHAFGLPRRVITSNGLTSTSS